MGLMEASLDDPKPVFKTLADNYMGKKFDSPNDAVYRSNGDLFFTDPPYGLEKNTADPAKEVPYQGVFKVSTNGEVTLLTNKITRPNGIAFFPGEKTLIVASSDPGFAAWFTYDLDENDSLVNGRTFYDATAEAKKDRGLPDGLKIDAGGHIFATGPGGIWVFDLAGKVLGRIRVNGVTSNCALADNDRTLYVTAEKYVLKIRLR
jgi:gluconolactonase